MNISKSIEWSFLIVTICLIQGYFAQECQTIRCRSHGQRYRTCSLSSRMTGQLTIKMEDQLSSDPCIENETYGVSADKIWVSDSCKAYFRVCSEDNAGGQAPRSSSRRSSRSRSSRRSSSRSSRRRSSRSRSSRSRSKSSRRPSPPDDRPSTDLYDIPVVDPVQGFDPRTLSLADLRALSLPENMMPMDNGLPIDPTPNELDIGAPMGGDVDPYVPARDVPWSSSTLRDLFSSSARTRAQNMRVQLFQCLGTNGCRGNFRVTF